MNSYRNSTWILQANEPKSRNLLIPPSGWMTTRTWLMITPEPEVSTGKWRISCGPNLVGPKKIEKNNTRGHISFYFTVLIVGGKGCHSSCLWWSFVENWHRWYPSIRKWRPLLRKCMSTPFLSLPHFWLECS